MSLRATLDFLLHDWLAVGSLTTRPRFAEHSPETFGAVLDTCEKIAREKYAPFNRLVDTEEPRFDGVRVILPRATHEAHRAYIESGMLAAAQDYELGGMQLPYTVEAAANAFFAMASVSIGSNLLTAGNAGLLMAHGTALQKRVFAHTEYAGQWSGTMCLSEPQAGSSLSDITTRAVPDDIPEGGPGAAFQDDPLGPRYRLKGNKMWISSGEHELTENIIHLVLAKIPDAQGKLVPGTRGISLFIVPKHLVNAQAQLTGERNDVALAGLNHKCGWRGTTNTLLNFGEGKFTPMGKPGAIGYLVGQPGEGLRCMFHMMNKARIGVGMAATMLGMAGYQASLDYARGRAQGRPQGPSGKDPGQAQVPIIEHADVKRMLLAQKAYAEGALALELYCARLVDEQLTGLAQQADEARLLLEVLTPIAKSWPSEWCLEANSLAIQVHGGYGYTRDFPVEQYWRDNRLNMIHEGTHGIQGMDLLGRKVLMEGGRGLQLLAARMRETAARACDAAGAADAASAPVAAGDTKAAAMDSGHPDDLAAHGKKLLGALECLLTVTETAWRGGDAARTLANAVPYLQAFGHVVLAWIWLDVACAARGGSTTDTNAADAIAVQERRAAQEGRQRACRYFFHYELPKIGAWLAVVESLDQTCAAMPLESF